MIWTIQGTTEIYRFLLSSVLSIFWTVQYCLHLIMSKFKVVEVFTLKYLNIQVIQDKLS